MKRIFVFLMLAFLVFACTATAPRLAPTDTLSSTPTPLATVTSAQSSTPVPSTASPATTAVAHSALTTQGPYLAYLRSQGGRYEIVFTDADGSGQEIIPYPADANTQVGLPSLSSTLSPDGKWLAYYTGSAGKCFGNGGADTADLALNLVNLANGKSQVVTRLLSHDYPKNFVQAAQQLDQETLSADVLQNAFVCGITQAIAWSGDGRYLAFAGQMDGLSSDLYLYDMLSQTITRLSSGPEELQIIAWSQDGRWILTWGSYAEGEGMVYDLYVTSLDGSDVHKLPVSSCDTTSWLDDQTCFSFESENGVGTYNLALVNIKTSQVVPVWAGEFSSLAVSADHQWLAYFSHLSSQALKTGSDPNFTPGLYLVNLRTFKSSRVALPGNLDDYQSLQPLGSAERGFGLLNTSENTLYFLSPDGNLSSAGVNASRFSLSPDRQYLVAIGQKIHFLEADGTFLRDVDLPAALMGQGIQTILWRPDASGLFFTYQAPQDASTQFYALDRSTGGPRLVDRTSILSLGPSDFVWVGMPK